MKKIEKLSDIHLKIKIAGTCTLGPKGQVVIPKEIRNLLSLNPGDSILFIHSDENSHVGIIKNENLKDLLDYANSYGVKVDLN